MTTYTPLEDNSERRSRKQCIGWCYKKVSDLDSNSQSFTGLTLGGFLFSALLISSLVLNAHYIIRYLLKYDIQVDKITSFW